MSDSNTPDNVVEDYLTSTQIDNVAVEYLMNIEGITSARKLNRKDPDDILIIRNMTKSSEEQDIPFSSSQELYIGVGDFGDVLICYTPSIERAEIVA